MKIAGYNWDELELKYFGSGYKLLTPQEKLMRIFPCSSAERELFNRDAQKLSNETITEIYRSFISINENLPRILGLVKKVLDAEKNGKL